ncbi:proteasome subunit beta [Miniimonas arenae]|uniref:proteasome subunit beta n=1 Tax=Miniimonas arenae TaxID=676201 RepID=UPI0028B1FA03|nr:proteasome subunit beta [Miniimonas arenae]
MTAGHGSGARGGLGPAYLDVSGTSFLDFARVVAPDVVSARLDVAPAPEQTHATTIVALSYAGGVVMAGDRRATAGSMIAHREIEKVFPADRSCVIGIAGTAGIGLELVRLFQLELEHYEKIVGTPLSLEGKANRLAHLVRANLELAARGLLALPLLAGFDAVAAAARLYSYDAVGGRYAERNHHAIGSGAIFARGTLKNLWHTHLTESEGVEIAVASLLDAADDDSATGGVDLVRGIFPVVAVVDEGGYRRIGDLELAGHVERILALRSQARRD